MDFGATLKYGSVNFPSCWEIIKIACLLNGHSWQAMGKYKHSLEIMTGDHPGTINCAQCQCTVRLLIAVHGPNCSCSLIRNKAGFHIMVLANIWKQGVQTEVS